MNRDKIYSLAIQKYGFEKQLDQLTEECGELIVAANKFRRKGIEAVPSLVDELADVKIIVEQIENALCLQNEVKVRVDYKINRLKTRLLKD